MEGWRRGGWCEGEGAGRGVRGRGMVVPRVGVGGLRGGDGMGFWGVVVVVDALRGALRGDADIGVGALRGALRGDAGVMAGRADGVGGIVFAAGEAAGAGAGGVGILVVFAGVGATAFGVFALALAAIPFSVPFALTSSSILLAMGGASRVFAGCAALDAVVVVVTVGAAATAVFVFVAADFFSWTSVSLTTLPAMPTLSFTAALATGSAFSATAFLGRPRFFGGSDVADMIMGAVNRRFSKDV